MDETVGKDHQILNVSALGIARKEIEMDAAEKLAMALRLRGLLEQAHLPGERELIGQKFALTYEVVRSKGGGEDGLVRVSGLIYGVQLHASDSAGFELITSPLPRKWTSDTASPSISYFGQRGPDSWGIFFRHNNAEGRPDINAHEMFYGDLEML